MYTRAYHAGLKAAMKFFGETYTFNGITGWDALNQFISEYQLKPETRWSKSYLKGLTEICDEWLGRAKCKAKIEMLANKGVFRNNENFFKEFRGLDGFVIPRKVHFDASKHDIRYGVQKMIG